MAGEPRRRGRAAAAWTAWVAAAALLAAPIAAAQRYGLGRMAAPDEIAGWNIDVSPDGAGLPPGHGSVQEGEAVFASRCAACHGAHGEGKPMERLVGGLGTLHDKHPAKTVGSYWPYATTLYDYVHRAMPFDAPQSMNADEVYAVTAYVLYLNKIVAREALLDRDSLPKVKMPNRDGFYSEVAPAK